MGEVEIVEKEPRTKLHLLAVEDDKSIRELQKILFHSLGVAHVSAENAREAREILERDSSINAIMTDYDMPGDNGMVLALEVRESHPDMPIALATGRVADDKELGEKLTANNIMHVPKPYSREDLLQTTQVMEEQLNTPTEKS